MVSSYTANGEAFVAGKPVLWAEKKGLGIFDLAPDGKRFAVVHAEASEQKGPTHVTFLLNFFDELRRRVPAERKEKCCFRMDRRGWPSPPGAPGSESFFEYAHKLTLLSICG